MQKPIAGMQIKPVDFLLNIWYCRLRTPSAKGWLSLLLKLDCIGFSFYLCGSGDSGYKNPP